MGPKGSIVNFFYNSMSIQVETHIEFFGIDGARQSR